MFGKKLGVFNTSLLNFHVQMDAEISDNVFNATVRYNSINSLTFPKNNHLLNYVKLPDSSAEACAELSDGRQSILLGNDRTLGRL